MGTDLIEKDAVVAAVVRAFFKYFITGIIESQAELDLQTRFEPANVKMSMLNHYEVISHFFNKEAFFAFARLNYAEDEIEKRLRSFMNSDTTDMQLVRLACRTEKCYQTMVNEYKRNFELLLCGRVETDSEHAKAYTRCVELGSVDVDLAERIVSRMASNAYAAGKSVAGRQQP